MKAYTDKTQMRESQSEAHDSSKKKSTSQMAKQLADHRPEMVAQRKLQEMANNSPKARQTIQLQAMANHRSAEQLNSPHGTSSDSSQHNPLQAATDSILPIQCLKKHFPTRADNDPLVNYYSKAVGDVVTEVEKQVDYARGLALNWNQIDSEDTGYLGQWARNARKYYDNPTEVPKFIHANFGYAIETLACANLPSQHGGLTINFQVSKGHTRPDIVLSNPLHGEVAWLDITSHDSENHIQGKDSAGWRTKPFVYEVFYQPLNLSDILTGNEDPVLKALGEYLTIKNQIVHEEREKKRTALRDNLLGLQEEYQWKTLDGYNTAEKRKFTKNFLQSLGMDLGKNKSKATRGALAATDINEGPFGFNKGNIGIESRKAEEFINSAAAPEIQKRHEAHEEKYIELYKNMIIHHKDLPLVVAFYNYLKEGVNNEKIEIGTAVAASVKEYDMLIEAQKNLTQLSNKQDLRVIELYARIDEHIKQLPEELNFKTLQAWSNDALELRRHKEVLIAILIEEQQQWEAQQQLEAQQQQLFPHIGMNDGNQLFNPINFEGQQTESLHNLSMTMHVESEG